MLVVVWNVSGLKVKALNPVRFSWLPQLPKLNVLILVIHRPVRYSDKDKVGATGEQLTVNGKRATKRLQNKVTQ